MKILILCTGNSCRSQMADGFLKSFDKTIEVYSAGTEPAERVNPYAVQVMQEIGLDISRKKTNRVNEFIHDNFDYVITVCDHAKEACPVFLGKVKHRLHIGFADPAKAIGTDAEIISEFRRIRDKIKTQFSELYANELKSDKE
jgi:arsenate reductase